MLRADAKHNRELIVAAARTAFAAEGLDVSMAEIARRAGVGFATAQRRFPTKQALVLEVVRDQVVGLAEATAPAAGEDANAWDAFAAPIRACCAHQASEPGLAGALAQVLAAVDDPNTGAPAIALFERLADAAKASGDLYDDITLDDVFLVIKANAGVVANSPNDAESASARFVELVLRSLRR